MARLKQRVDPTVAQFVDRLDHEDATFLHDDIYMFEAKWPSTDRALTWDALAVSLQNQLRTAEHDWPSRDCFVTTAREASTNYVFEQPHADILRLLAAELVVQIKEILSGISSESVRAIVEYTSDTRGLEGSPGATKQVDTVDPGGPPLVDLARDVRERFSVYSQVAGVYIEQRFDDINVIVVLTAKTWDGELMDRLLEVEYQVRQNKPDMSLSFVYPPLGRPLRNDELPQGAVIGFSKMSH